MQEEAVTFDLFQPMYIIFNRDGTLHIYSEVCGFGTYAIAYLSEQRYQFGDGMFTAQDCGAAIFEDNPTIDCAVLAGKGADVAACIEAIRQQQNRVHAIFRTTREYRLGENELYLLGEAAEIYLVLDNP